MNEEENVPLWICVGVIIGLIFGAGYVMSTKVCNIDESVKTTVTESECGCLHGPTDYPCDQQPNPCGQVAAVQTKESADYNEAKWMCEQLGYDLAHTFPDNKIMCCDGEQMMNCSGYEIMKIGDN